MITNQQIFDKVFNHAKAQREEFGNDAQSMGSQENDGCLYRCKLDDGRVKMCFIGPFIPNDSYVPSMEGAAVRNLFSEYPLMMLWAGLDKDTSFKLLRDLQYLHDEKDPIDWDQGFARLANKYDLQCTIEYVIKEKE